MEYRMETKDGRSLFCRVDGEGDPLLLIHGACVDSTYFREAAALLSTRYRVVTYDRRGYGRSDDFEDHSIRAQAEDAAELIRTIGRPCHVVAHSGGTVIARELLRTDPEPVRTLLLYEPVDAACEHGDPALTARIKKIRTLITEQKYNRAATEFLPLLGETTPGAGALSAEELERMSRNTRCFMKYEFLPFFSYTAPVSEHGKCSIYIGLGERSNGTFRRSMGEHLARRLDADIIGFPGGHNGPAEFPNDFARILMDVLSGSGRS